MRRNQDVPAIKSTLEVFRLQSVSKPLSHSDSTALNSFSCFGFESGQQNISIKEYTSGKFEIPGNGFLIKVTPFFGSIQKLRDLFDSKVWGFHNNSDSPASILVLLVGFPTSKNQNHYLTTEKI